MHSREINLANLDSSFVLDLSSVVSKSIPRFPVVKWLRNEVNIFQSAIDINDLFPVETDANTLIKLTKKIDTGTLKQIVAVVEHKIKKQKLSYNQFSNWFLIEFANGAVSFIIMLVALNFFRPTIFSVWDTQSSWKEIGVSLPSNEVILTFCSSITGVIFVLYLLNKVNVKLHDSILAHHILSIAAQVRATK